MSKYKKSFVKIFLIIAFLILGLFFVLKTANGQTGEIVFSEIAWMGTTAEKGYYCEWIELYNTTNIEVNLSDWSIYEQNGDVLIINLTKKIAPYSYYLVERITASCPDAVTQISADDSGSFKGGGLSNGGEYLQLFDASNNLIDDINASGGWPAGDNLTKETMARTITGSNGFSWVNGPIGGTPRSQNLSFTSNNNNYEDNNDENSSTQQDNIQASNEDSSTEISTEENSDEPLKTIQEFVRTKAVIINEFLPNPQGADSEGEWIELFNTSEESVDLSNWYLDDIDGGSKEYKIPLGIIIAPQSYLIFLRKDTNIALNNNADFVRLLYPDKTIAYEVDYTETAKDNISFAVFNDNWQWTDNPTPENKNIASSIKNNKASTKLTNKNQKSKINNQTEKIENINIENAQEFSAQIAQNKNIKSPIFIFLIVGILSLTAGIGFIFIKNKFFAQQED